jgi:hypothetical protein
MKVKFSPPAKLRQLLMSLVLFGLALVVYLANQKAIATCDSVPNSVLLFHWLEHHTVDMTRYVQAGIDSPTSCSFLNQIKSQPGQPWITGFPIGPAIVTAPLYCLFYLHFKITHAGAALNLTSPEFHTGLRLVYEKWAAAIVAATSVALLFQVAARLFKHRIALGIALIFAFATTTWSASSQALWQHGSLNLAVITMLWSFLQAISQPQHKTRWLLLAGVCGGLLPGIRPSSLAYGLAGLLSALWTWRRRSWPFLVGCLSALPALLWNIHWYQSPFLGGYDKVKTGFSLSYIPASLPGLLFSPSRGLFVFIPIALFAIPGLIYLWRKQKSAADWLVVSMAIASGLVIFNYSTFYIWWAGSSYGPRFMTDIQPTLCLLMGYCLMRWRNSRPRHRLLLSRLFASLFVLAAAYSTLLQYAGVVAKIDWNSVPTGLYGVEEEKRLWQWSDSQPIRHLRSLYNHPKYSAQLTSPQAIQNLNGKIFGHAYRSGTKPEIVDNAIVGAPNEQGLLTVTLQNLSPDTWQGYDSGVGAGEVFVHGMVVEAKSQKTVTGCILSIKGRHAPKQIATAVGNIILPPQPGTYELILWPSINTIWIPPQLKPATIYRLPLQVLPQPVSARSPRTDAENSSGNNLAKPPISARVNAKSV